MAIAARYLEATFSLTGGGGGGTHRGGGGVQIPQVAVGTVRRRLGRSPAQKQEGKAGVGVAWKVAMEGGGGAGSFGNFLPRSSPGGALVWSGDMGAFGTNDADIRGSTCGFTAAGHSKTGNLAEGWVLSPVQICPEWLCPRSL